MTHANQLSRVAKNPKSISLAKSKPVVSSVKAKGKESTEKRKFVAAFPVLDRWRPSGMGGQWETELLVFEAADEQDAWRVLQDLDARSLIALFTDPAEMNSPEMTNLEGADLLRAREIELGKISWWGLDDLISVESVGAEAA